MNPFAATPGILQPIRRRLGQAATFAEALLAGERVAPDLQAAREAVCAACPFSQISNLKSPMPGGAQPDRRCTLCGCPVSGGGRVRNLAAYAERLPQWGCKHPRRAQGEGWPR